MKFIWYVMPKPEGEGGKSKELPPGGLQAPTIEKGRTKMGEIGADLKNFIETAEKATDQQKKEFLEKTRQWEQTQNTDELRRAGITAAENEKDPTKKHQLLAAVFLDRDKKTSNKMSFKVDFKHNELAEDKVGAGDLLPITAKVIRVQYAAGPPKEGSVIERAVRAINPENGRIGYYEEAAFKRKEYQYVPVFSGTQIDVLETQTPEAWRLFAENREIYNSNRHEAVTASAAPSGPVRPLILPGYGAPGSNPASNHAAVPGSSPLPGGEAQPGSLNTQNPAVARNPGGTESPETAVDRQKLIDTARRYINVPREEFRSADVQGGNLACAKVATTILKEAGFLQNVEMGVDQTVQRLLDRGWTISHDHPEGGDVIVWAPLVKRYHGAVDDAPQYMKGHKHIGIAVSPDQAVNNSSAAAMPVLSAIYTGRPVEAILKPPGALNKPAVAETKVETESPNLKLNTDIRERLSAFMPEIQEASQKYHVPQNLIMAVIMQESGGNPHIASKAKAGGLMQLEPFIKDENGELPLTYPIIARGKGYLLDERDWRNDPRKNIMAGTKLLASHLKRYNGDVVLALAAYNAGAPRVAKYHGVPPFAETQKYVAIIPRMFKSLDAEDAAAQPQKAPGSLAA